MNSIAHGEDFARLLPLKNKYGIDTDVSMLERLVLAEVCMHTLRMLRGVWR